jgi:magnesium transporter
MKQSLIRLALPPAPQASQQSLEHAGLTWLVFRDPRQEHVSFLAQQYHFHPLHIDDILSRSQRPKIDDNPEQEYVFLVMHFPVFDEVTRLSTISEIDIFVGRDFLIITHDGRLKPLRRLVQRADDLPVRAELMSRGPGFLLYSILAELTSACSPMLFQLYQKLDDIDERIFKDNVKATVEELSYLRRDIISLRRIIKPNIPVLRSLANRERLFLQLDTATYFGDLSDNLATTWDMLEEQKEIIEGLDATLSSVSSHRINQEMKIFTLITVICLPMTLLASIVGMNVYMPLADHPLALPILLLIMVALAYGMLAFFRRKHWV